MEIKILYEDRFLIVCEKPVGVLSQLDAKGGDSMPARLSERLGGRYVGVVHRLDTATGGVIMYAKKEDVCGKLSALVSGEGYKKEYLAVLDGELTEPCGELSDYLFHDRMKNKSFAVKGERKGAKLALLDYELISISESGKGKKSLVRVRLHTGRTHQIRVQFASRGLPISGDGKYGSRDNKCPTALWAHRCEFIHPVTGKLIRAESCPPREYPWSLFDQIFHSS